MLISDYKLPVLPESKIEIIFNTRYPTKDYVTFIKGLLTDREKRKEFTGNMLRDLKDQGVDLHNENSEICLIHEKLKSSLAFVADYTASPRFIIRKNSNN